MHQNIACAVNNPHGIYSDPRKKSSIHFHQQSGCPFCEVNLAFILKLLSDKFNGLLRYMCSPSIYFC